MLSLVVRILILLILLQTSYSLVKLELSVLQYDNPLGTAYIAKNTTQRKLCDTDIVNSAGRRDTCDVYFVFCIGRAIARSCQGKSVSTVGDVSTNVYAITGTEALRLTRFLTIDRWDENNTHLFVKVMDKDSKFQFGSNEYSENTSDDLIEVFSEPLNFVWPGADYWSAKSHLIHFAKHVSVDVRIRACCANNWFGIKCERSCAEGRDYRIDEGMQPYSKCNDTDVLTLRLQQSLEDIPALPKLKLRLVQFLTHNVCPTDTYHVKATIIALKETVNETDVIFKAQCNNKTISKIKLHQVLSVSNLLKRPMHIDDFGVPVFIPTTQLFYSNTSQPKIFALFHIRSHTNWMAYANCFAKETLCKTAVNVSFMSPQLTPTIQSLSQTTLLSECHACVDAIANIMSELYSTSTFIMGLEEFPTSVLIERYCFDRLEQNCNKTSIILFHLKDIVTVGTDFLDAAPYVLPPLSPTDLISIDVLAWCAGGYCGASCNSTCLYDTIDCKEYKNCLNGHCINGACICHTGWTGVNCSFDVDECELGECINAHDCKNTFGNYSCECLEGFRGSNCDMDIDECGPNVNKCDNESVCLNTYGSYVCVDSESTRQNYSDDAHEICTRSPCLNGGSCLTEAQIFQCACFIGWSGLTCESDINECDNSSICQNGGSCINTRGSFSCHCSSGFSGKHCEMDVNVCNNNQCQHGSCNNTIGGFICTCNDGWTGYICETDIDECRQMPYDRCLNGGSCINHEGLFSCLCPVGWTGIYCDNETNECEGHGHCDQRGNYSNVDESFKDKNGTNACLGTNFCSNGSTCVALSTGEEYFCLCPSGWTGRYCINNVMMIYGAETLNTSIPTNATFANINVSTSVGIQYMLTSTLAPYISAFISATDSIDTSTSAETQYMALDVLSSAGTTLLNVDVPASTEVQYLLTSTISPYLSVSSSAADTRDTSSSTDTQHVTLDVPASTDATFWGEDVTASTGIQYMLTSTLAPHLSVTTSVTNNKSASIDKPYVTTDAAYSSETKGRSYISTTSITTFLVNTLLVTASSEKNGMSTSIKSDIPRSSISPSRSTVKHYTVTSASTSTDKRDMLNWFESHTTVIAGVGGGLVVAILILIIVVCLNRRASDAPHQKHSTHGVDVELTDTLSLHNQVYDIHTQV